MKNPKSCKEPLAQKMKRTKSRQQEAMLNAGATFG